MSNQRFFGRRRLRRLGIAALAVFFMYATGVMVAYFVQDRFVFPGTLHRVNPAGPGDSRVEALWLTTDEGYRVEAWFEAGKGRAAANPGPAVLYFHGNGDVVDQRWPAKRALLDRGISVMCPEYRGYGRSTGTATQTGIVSDALAFYDCLFERPEVDSRRIILHGTSIGGAVAAAVAEKRPCAAIILECTFANMELMANRYWVPSFACESPFHTDRVVAGLDAPILLMHGLDDWTIPFEHALWLKAAAPRATLVEMDCGHHDFPGNWPAIRAFLLESELISGENR